MHVTRHAAQAVLLARPAGAKQLTCRVALARRPPHHWPLASPQQCTHAGRHARCAGSAAAAAAAESERPPAICPDADSPLSKRAGKRKVALFVGYEGTGFRGLQMQQSAPQETVEDALEEAIFRAGGILESNRGSLSKVKWSRSSRTDKSVHSLATVVGMKMEVPAEAFEGDPEGRGLAAAINAHLPPQVRVFSVQRVSKSWNARTECIRRTYRYFLPASALGLALDGGAEDAARLQRLADAWGAFQGSHPFHNYTRRRLYRETGGHRRRGGEARGADSEADSDSEAEDAAGEPAGAEGAAPDSKGGDGVQGVPLSGPAAAAAADSPKGQVVVEWKGEKDAADLVTRRHHRFIEWCHADTELRTLVPGGHPCVELSLQGGSFMLHQIRHQVGMAVAVARGTLPLALLHASLATPARMATPLAPPSTLVLAGAQFSPFKRSWSGEAAAAARVSGDSLALREEGAAAQDAFFRERMLPALNGLLAGEEWQRWERDLQRLWYEPAEVDRLLQQHASWAQQQAAAREERMRAAAEAAAGQE